MVSPFMPSQSGIHPAGHTTRWNSRDPPLCLWLLLLEGSGALPFEFQFARTLRETQRGSQIDHMRNMQIELVPRSMSSEDWVVP